MRRLFLTIGVLLSLVIGVVPAFADNGAPKTAADQASKEASGQPGVEVNCPSANGAGNSEQFNTRWWTSLFIIQRGPNSGGVRVNISFLDGSPAARVRLYNTQTYHTTPYKTFTSANATQSFEVGCGNWDVQITSATGSTFGTLRAAPY
jgi:hypothetical protein